MRRSVEDNLKLDRVKLERGELYKVTDYLKNKVEALAVNVDFDNNGGSINNHSWMQLDKHIDRGYERICEDYEFVSRIVSKPKKLILSPLMTYTHISGIYIPFTGEANINTNYPDYVVAFTVAHEKAHQRGIAGEDDANFIAFMALLASEDEYLRYVALMNMYDYFLDAIYENDIEMYYHFFDNTNEKVLGEMQAYFDFFQKYKDSGASKIADTVNDNYLKAMGENDGIKSYGKVVELFAASLQKNNGLPY